MLSRGRRASGLRPAASLSGCPSPSSQVLTLWGKRQVFWLVSLLRLLTAVAAMALVVCNRCGVLSASDTQQRDCAGFSPASLLIARAPDEVRGEPSPAAKLAKISPPPLIALYISPLRRGRGAHKKAASGAGNQFSSRRPAAVSPGINLSHLPVSLFAPAAGQVGAQESRACEFSSQARPLKSRML